jgi:methyl-accepting chemotaxis protein
MKQVRLTVKLMGGFALVALVTLLVGIFGWYGASQLGSNLQGVVSTTLPSIQNVLTIKESLESVRVATRTLLNPFLTPEVRKRQLDNIKAARDRVKTAMDALEPLLQSESEKSVWTQFVPALSAYVQETDNFLQLAHELDLTGVLNPLAMRSDMERFRGDHYNVLYKTAYLLATQTSFEGSEDPSGCDFGKWMAKYQANNPRIGAALKEIAASHAVFHHDVKKIKDNVKNHELDGAVLLYRKEMVPAAEKTIGLMGQILAEANLASELYSKMNEQAMVVTYAKQREALGQLDKLVTMQKDDAQTTRVAAQAATTRTKWLVLVGMGVGVVAAVLLGVCRRILLHTDHICSRISPL